MALKVADTERLILRHLTPGDAEFLCLLLNEPSWLHNIGDRDVRTPEDAERYIQTKSMEMYQRLGFGMYLVESRQEACPDRWRG